MFFFFLPSRSPVIVSNSLIFSISTLVFSRFYFHSHVVQVKKQQKQIADDSFSHRWPLCVVFSLPHAPPDASHIYTINVRMPDAWPESRAEWKKRTHTRTDRFRSGCSLIANEKCFRTQCFIVFSLHSKPHFHIVFYNSIQTQILRQYKQQQNESRLFYCAQKKNAARFAQYTIRTYISIVCGCVRWSLISNSYIYSALVCQCVLACIISCRLRRIEWLLFIQTQHGLSSVCVSWRNRNKKYFFMYFYHNNVNSHNNVFWHSWVKKKKEVYFVLDVE